MKAEINPVQTFCLWSFRNDLRRLFLQKVGPNQKHWIPEGHRKEPEGFPEANPEAFSSLFL